MDTDFKMKIKCYEMYSNTIDNLVDEANSVQDRWGTKTLLNLKVNNISDMDEEQKEMQLKHSWDRHYTTEVRVTDQMIYDAARDIMFKKALGGEKKNILEETYNKIVNSKVQVLAEFYNNEDEGILRMRTDVFFLVNNRYEYDISYDKEEMENKLKDARVTSWNYGASNGRQQDIVMLEEARVEIRAYTFENLKNKIRKIIKKIAGTELAYCIKNGEVIVPDEYLEKGEGGITEWIEIKRSGNKNNSMEKQMLKQEAANKRSFAYETMCKVMHAVISANEHDWSTPVLEIDGRYNKTRTQKLVAQILDTRNRQKLFETSEEEILKQFKDHWKDTLMTAYNAVDKMTLEEE